MDCDFHICNFNIHERSKMEPAKKTKLKESLKAAKADAKGCAKDCKSLDKAYSKALVAAEKANLRVKTLEEKLAAANED